MKSVEELKAFVQGYRAAMMFTHKGDVSEVDDWVLWGGYDLNLFGSYYGVRLNDDTTALSVDAYPQGWAGDLPDAIHSFDITGETA